MGFIPLEGLSNLEVLAILVGVNGGFHAQIWGDIDIGEHPYGYRGLATFNEVTLLIAMVNYGAGICTGSGEDRGRLEKLVTAQIDLDNPHIAAHPPQ